MSKGVEEYYDEFSKNQVKTDINKRHLTIEKWLLKFGLNEHSKVLEIGCGIGTVTELILRHNKQGNVLAVDISTKSINLAKSRLVEHKNLTLLAGDIIDIDLKEKFDLIVLPDVLEHIPIEQHNLLFAKLSALLEATGSIVIHIPNPYYLEWLHKNRPEQLQIIDQPLYTNVLAETIYKNNLYIHHLENYSIWIDNCDYQVVLLKKKRDLEYNKIENEKSSILRKIMNKLIKR